MTIEVNIPTFQYLIEDPSKVRYEISFRESRRCFKRWKTIVVQTYYHGLPEPKEGEILFKYTENRGYLEKITKSFNNWLYTFK